MVQLEAWLKNRTAGKFAVAAPKLAVKHLRFDNLAAWPHH